MSFASFYDGSSSFANLARDVVADNLTTTTIISEQLTIQEFQVTATNYGL